MRFRGSGLGPSGKALAALALFASASCRVEPSRTSAEPSRETALATTSAPPAHGAGARTNTEGPPPNRPVSGEESTLYSEYDRAPALETQVGRAAYYSDKFAGRKTASGQPYDPRAFTAAHRKLPFDTVVRVVRLDDGRHVYVRITDRGPFGERKRIVDLSKIAAERLDMLRSGVIDVRLEVVRWGDGRGR